MKKIAITALASILMVSSAYAQFLLPSEHEKISATGIVRVKADMIARYVTPLTTDFVASNLIGVDVYDITDEEIGEVKDIILRQNNIDGIVISIGGFLGMGEHYVVVSPEKIQMKSDDGKWKLMVNVTKNALKEAPKFKYEDYLIR
ncbi:PRC-barrel domain-containing protein [Bartonella sp. WD16.2]|uniref:PRC-barrel domain-containing protein n=1 Tax=Bartonella sp. WD16.2 TaxID=1933904 RepID=UPI00099ADA1B|nr:PRC-barrel domain-containing protein [Bartonella sp. WD16.2]AQX20080.1 PRC-barrel domain-containing protein [Bartonella sp. WD16.2]